MNDLPYLKERTSLWYGDTCLTFLKAGTGISLAKIQYPNKILIEAVLPHGLDFMENLDPLFTLELLHKEDGRLDIRPGQQPLFTFKDCQLIRKWIPDISSVEFRSGFIIGHLKYRCEIVRHNG